MCHPYHRGGVTRWMADAALAAAKNGDDVYFITVEPVVPFYSGKGRETMLSLVKSHPANFKIISTGADHLYEFGTQGYRSKIYIDLIKKHVPEGTPIVLSDDAGVWDAAGYLADKYPMLGVIHGNDDIYFANARQHAAHLSACICVSDRIRKNLMERCPQVREEIIKVIPCGINMPQFAPEFRSDKYINLIFIGRIEDKVKRATDLVGICNQLHQHGLLFHLEVIGNGKESGEEMQQSFNKAGIGGHVTFRGWLARNEIQQLLNESDILLLTSNSEGMPLVMMEALASGCGFVGTRVSGIEDYELHPLAKDCFGVYTIGDVTDAAEKIKHIANEPVKIRQQSARQLAESEFSMQVCLDRYNSVLKGLRPAASHFKGAKISDFDLMQSKVLAMARYLKVKVVKG